MAYLWTRLLSNHELLDVEAFHRGSGPRPACMDEAAWVEDAAPQPGHPEPAPAERPPAGAGIVVDGALVGICDGARVLDGNVAGLGWDTSAGPDSTVYTFGDCMAVSYTGDDHMAISLNGEEVLRYPVAAGRDGAQAALIAEVKRLRVLLAQRPEPDARAQVVCDHGYDD